MKLTTRLVYAFNRMLRPLSPVKILSAEESLDCIQPDDVSLARYGDGEMNIMVGGDIHFQKFDATLRKRLIEILAFKQDKFYIGLPPAINSYDGYKPIVADFYRMNMSTGRMHWFRYCNWHETYLNGQFTWALADSAAPEKKINVIKKVLDLWQDKDILIVEGATGRLGIDSDMLKGAKSIKRILCPSTNAFDHYDEILNSIISHCEKGQRILICLGPTATVLVYDLFRKSIPSIDLGHINKEYALYRKYAGIEMLPEGIIDEAKYQGQIIDTIDF